MKTNIFINGLQRSGTNYALELFKNNLPDCNVSDYTEEYTKHNMFNKEHTLNNYTTITIIKNPYTWIESICFRNCVDIIEYYSDYKLCNGEYIIGNFNISLKNILKLYKDYYLGWLNNSILMRYEDIINQVTATKKINKIINLSNKIEIPNYLVKQSAFFKFEQIREYQNFETKYLTSEDIGYINDALEESFIEIIGYNVKK